MNDTNRRLAVLIIRFYLGVLFLMVGAGRVFVTGISSFVTRLQEQFAETPLPGSFLQMFGSTLPFVEIGVGTLLLVGFFRRESFVSVSFLLVILALGQVMIDDFAMASNNAVHLLIALTGLCLIGKPLLSLDGMFSPAEEYRQ